MVRGIVEEVVCVAALVCVAVYALAPTVFGDYAPFHADSLFADAPWEAARPPGWEGPLDLQAPDTANTYYPAYRFISESAHSGESVLWNPLEYGGAPFLAQWRTRCLSPFTVPFYLMPLGAAIRWSVFLKVLVAGLCAYVGARRLGYHRPFSLMVAAVFQLNAGLLLWLAHPLSDVAPWFPLFFVSCELMSLGRSRYWAPGGLALGLMLLGGAPEAALAAVAFVIVYHALRLVFTGGRGGIVRPMVGLAGACLSAAALAAAQIAPFIESMGEMVQTRAEAATPLAFAESIAVVSLQCAEMISERAAHGPMLALTGHLHLGLVALLSVALWLAVRPSVPDAHRFRIDALLITSALTIPGAYVLSHFPFAIGPLRLEAADLLLPLPFAIAVAGASAAESWLELNPAQCTSAIKRLGVIVPVVAISLALWFSALLGFRVGFYGESAILLTVYLGIGVTFFLLLGITLVRPLPSVIGYGLAALVIAELAWQVGPAQPFSPLSDIAPDSDFVRHLEREDVRIGGGEGLWKWPLAANGIAQIGGASGVAPKRTFEFLEQCTASPSLLLLAGCPTLVLSRDDIEHGFARLRARLRMRHVFPSGAVQFDNLGPSDRGRLVYEVRQEETTEATDVIPGAVTVAEWKSPLSLRPDEDGQLTVEESHNDRVVMRVRQGGEGVAVLADTFYPGWAAYANGEKAPLFPVDYAFRGVPVGPGDTTIEMRYEPVSWQIGLYISALGVIALLVGNLNLAVGWIRGRAAARGR